MINYLNKKNSRLASVSLEREDQRGIQIIYLLNEYFCVSIYYAI